MLIKDVKVKVIPEFDSYAISSDGRLFKIRTQYELNPRLCSRFKNYLRVNLSHKNIQKKKFIHVLVALAWIPNPDNKPTVNHMDGNTLNNDILNLEWATQSEQQQHSGEVLLTKTGEKAYNASMSDETCHIVCAMLQDGRSATAISTACNISEDCARQIRKGNTWKHISKHYSWGQPRRRKFSDETIHWLCRQIQAGLSNTEILNLTTNKELTRGVIRQARHKRLYKDITETYEF